MSDIDLLLSYLADNNARISDGNKWLCVERTRNIKLEFSFIVYSRPRYARQTYTEYEGNELDIALIILRGE